MDKTRDLYICALGSAVDEEVADEVEEEVDEVEEEVDEVEEEVD